jgi:hypothetical protein
MLIRVPLWLAALQNYRSPVALCFEISGPWSAAEFPPEHSYIQHQITHI